MKLKKIFMAVLLLFFSNLPYCRGFEEIDENININKTSRKISQGFKSFFKSCTKIFPCCYPKTYTTLKNCEMEESMFLKKQFISHLPIEVLFRIAQYLSPYDILNLIKTHKLFSVFKTNSFWRYYNKKHTYNPWDEKIPEIKVAFAFYWYKNDQVQRASKMGLPQALKYCEEQKRLKKENSHNSKFAIFLREPHYSWKSGDIFGYFIL